MEPSGYIDQIVSPLGRMSSSMVVRGESNTQLALRISGWGVKE